MATMIKKRSGETVRFDTKKIYAAVAAANKETHEMSKDDINQIVLGVNVKLSLNRTTTVEEVQDLVEEALADAGFFHTSKAYILYREKHREQREAAVRLMEEYDDLLFTDPKDMDLKRDNANINTDAPMGIMLKLGTEGAKSYVYNYFLDSEVSKACKDGILHYHDADFSLITFNCLDGESKVSLKVGDAKKYVPFNYFDDLFHGDGSEIIDVSHKNWETLSQNGEYTKINKVMRRPQSSGILKITTKDGKVLRASEDHIFVTVDGKEKEAKKLRVGEELPVAVFPKHFLPSASEDINLIDLFDHDLGKIYIANTDYVNANLPEDLRTFIELRTDRYKQYKNSKSISFSLAEYKLIRKYANLDESKIQLTTRGSKNCIPAVLAADEKIGKYIGYILTEGSLSDYGITFSNKDEEILADFKALQEDLFPNVKVTPTVNASGVTIFIMNSKLMRYLFEDAIAHKTNSSDIALADRLLYANESFTRGFVTAMIDGDGSMQNDGYRIRFSTTSEKAAVQLQYMLDTMNVKARLLARESAGQKVAINGIETVRHYDSYIVDVTGDSLNAYRRAFPNTIIVNRVQKTLTNAQDHHRGKIVSIEKEAFDGFVYDFETEDHFFMANGILVHNCCQIRLAKLLKDGFSTGHGFLREPNSIRSAAALAAIAIQANQNDQFGGQSINALDYDLAPYVNKSFAKAVRNTFDEWCRFEGGEAPKKPHPEFDKVEYLSDMGNVVDAIWNALKEEDAYMVGSQDAARIYNVACDKVKDETHQAMEALVHNLNTLHSRAGAQVPFSSINYGLCTSPAGRLVIDETLNAIYEGLGHGETAIFPISVFQIKAGVNYNPGDPNYDLFQKACAVSAKRLFPNFVNLDAPYNAKFYVKDDPDTHVSTMGCRTRVMSNVNGPEISGSRGNFASMTINLPMLALMAKEQFPTNEAQRIKCFYELYDKYISMCHDALVKRYAVISHKKAKNFPFLMGQGVWLDSEKLGPEDEIGPVLKHCSISIGFCGLAECLVALTGHHHGEDDHAQEVGLGIVSHLHDRTQEYTQKEHMNWSTFGSPTESTAGDMARACQKKFGKVPSVCDREYLTNSSHLPVYFKTSFKHKVDMEAPYHALEDAGHIGYIELDGDPSKNVKAFESIVRYMHDKDMGYFSINHPIDRDPVCGYTGLIENECPHCHRREDGHYHEVLKREVDE